MGTVIFLQPNSPEEFGVALAPAELRRLDFSALDYESLQRAGIEYIRTYYPNEFNDFFASNGIIMMLELVSYVGNVLSQRSDILVDEAFLPTAQTKEAVIQHLGLINQEITRATPAVVDVEISLASPAPNEIQIPAATRFTVAGPDQSPVYYEIFRAPGDFVSSISIPPGKRGVITHGIEGITETPITVTSIGGAGQTVDIPYVNVIDEPITVQVTSGVVSENWARVAIIEKSGANDKVFEVKHRADKTTIKFGDDITGKAPLAGQIVTVGFRLGGGVRGRIPANTINETRPVNPLPPTSAAVDALFRNPSPSSGGTDEESTDQAKRRAPREFATHDSAVTGEDYGLLAAEFTHPVFGAVAKAIGIARTGVDQDLEAVATRVREAPDLDSAVEELGTNFINRNIIELYVLAEGPGSTLLKPSSGLKQGLITYFQDINVLSDELRVFDGAVKPVDIDAIVTMSRGTDPGTVKAAVVDAINNFFDIRNFDMGTGLYLSNLYQTIQAVAGVKFVDIFEPADDILATNQLGDPTSKGVGFNEVITLGEVDVKFYFEPGNYRVPPTAKI